MTKNYDMRTLSEVKTMLAELPAGATVQGVTLDWFSDRGSYRNLAIRSGEGVSASDLFNTLTDATGRIMTGWKGGDFEVLDGNVVTITAEEGLSGDHIIGIERVIGADNTWEFVTVSNAYLI